MTCRHSGVLQEDSNAGGWAVLALSAFLLALSIVIAPVSAISASFVQTTARSAGGSASSLPVAFNANTVAGDIILVDFDYGASATPSAVTDSQGNTFSPVGNQLTTPGGKRLGVYYAKNIKGGADTVTVALSGSCALLEVYLTEYAGLDPTSPIDAQAGTSGAAGAVSSGTATTTNSGDIIYGYCVADESCTVGTGFAPQSTFDGNLVESRRAGSVGAWAATATANGGWAMQMLALKPVDAPTLSFSTSSLSFGSIPVDVTSSGKTITLTNTGGAALNISSRTVMGTNAADFLENSTCGSSLAAGAKCAVVVLFTPQAAGARSASLSITDNASGSPQSVRLSGTGLHDVTLSWTGSGSGVSGYNLYRGTAAGAESNTPLNSTVISGTTYTDATVTAGVTYYYFVTATGSSGMASAKSNEAQATVPSP